MTTFIKPIPHELIGFARVSLAKDIPTVAEVTLQDADCWHVFHMSRRQLELLHHEIGERLKAAPLRARGR